LRDISAEALIRSLHLALLGEPVCAIHKHLLRTPKTDALPLENPSVAMLNLCPRERSILQCLTVGRSNKEIARELSLSEATVKAHVKVIMRKLKARNRTQAAIWGIANGMERRAPAMLELA
jgi:two-component system nitrate/nitrite response regulator NarL